MTLQTQILASFDQQRIYSVAEFMQLEFAGVENSELLDGRISLTPPPGDEHGRVADEIRHHLSLFDPKRQLGRVWMNSRFQLNDKTALAPDLAFVLAARVPPRATGVVTCVPDLAVEIVSPTDEPKDIKAKIEIYLAAQTPLLWLIYPTKKRVDIYRVGQTAAETLGLADILSGENIIVGFQLPIKNLFED